MASKIDQDRKKDESFDDEFGSMGGFDDISLDDPFGGLSEPGGGRKPMSPTKDMLISGVKGVGQGLQSGFKSELFKAMPNVEPVVGEITESFNEFKDLKDEVGKKLAPMMTTLENSARKILPKAQAFIPKGMYEKITKKLDERAESRAMEAGLQQTKEQQEAEYISNSLNEIFGAQMEAQQASDLAAEQRHLADQAVEAERHEAALAASGHLYQSARATEIFHKTIHTAYLKKSLELKYKHIFIARDTYNLLAESMKSFNGYLQAIQKNTMLPDMAKVEIGDYHRKAMTQKYGELMTNFMSGFRKKLFGNIKKRVLDTVSSIGDAVDMAGQGVDMMEMAQEMGGGGFNPKNLAAQGGGWLLGKLGGSPIFKKMAQKYAPLLKSANKGVGGFANALALKGANLKRNWEASDSRVLNFFADFLPGLTPQTSGSNDLVDRGEKPATFDTMTRQSIVEIIPGYLSKILHSVDILRTGDENTEQQVYNVYSRKFTSVDELKEGYYDKLYGAEATRRGIFQDALATLKAGVTNNKTTEDPTAFYKKYEKDVNKFLINHALKAQFLNLAAIGEHLTRTDKSYVSQYIQDITKGFENDPDEVLRAIYQGCLAEDGDVDKNLVQDLEEAINGYRKMDSFKTEMPRLFELYGYRSYLSDKYSLKTKESLEKQAKGPDKDAAAKAKEMLAAGAGIISDNNSFNLSNLTDTQANIDYSQVDTSNAESERLEELKTAKEADAQIAELKEKTGYNRVTAWMGKQRDAASVFGRDIMARAKGKFDQSKTFLSDIASNFSEFASKIVTDPIYRAGILADLEAKGIDLLNAGKEGGQKVMDLAKEIREDPKAAMDKLRASSKEKFEEIKDAVVDKAEKTKQTAKEFYESHVSEETRAKIDKGIDKATGAAKAAAAAVGKAYDEHAPESVKNVVKKVGDVIPTSKEEAAELLSTVKDTITKTVEKIPTDKEGIKKAAADITQAVQTKTAEVLSQVKETVDKHTPESVKKTVGSVKKKVVDAAVGGGGEPLFTPPAGPSNVTFSDEDLTVFKVFMDSCRETLHNLETQTAGINAVINTVFASKDSSKPTSVIDAIMTVNQTLLDAREKADTTASVDDPLAGMSDEKAETLKQILEEFKFQSEFRTEQIDEWKKQNSEEMGILFDTMATWKGSQEQLLAAITEKIGTAGGGGGDGNGFNHDALISALEQGGYIKKRGMLQMIGGGIKSAAGAAGKVAKGLGHYAGLVYGGALKGAGSALKGAFGFAGNVVNKAAKAAKWMVEKPTFVDIYRKGEEGGAPLVSARMQKEDPGVVFADNGERVKASKDINRPVKDPRTGNYLITAEDLEHGLSMPDGSPIGKLLGGAAGLLKSYFGVTGAAVAGAFKLAGSMFKTASNVVFGKSAEPYCDIYVKGHMDKPILTRLKQERDPGVVFKDGTRVKYSSDIHEPVYDPVEKDAAGISKMLISEEDIKAGLVDANGKKLSMNAGTRGLVGATANAIEKLTPFLGKGLKGAGGLYATVFKGLFGLGMGAAKGVGKVLGRVFGIDTGSGTDVNKELLDAVKKIRDDVELIASDKKKAAGDADGDGDVDGTYADQMQNADKEKKGPTFAEHVDVDWRKKNEEGEGKDGGNGDSGLWGKAKKWMTDKLGNTKYGKMMKGWFEGAKTWSKGMIKGFGSKLGGFTKTLGGKLGIMLKGLGGHLGTMVKGFGGILGKLPGMLGGAFKGLGGLLGKIPGLGKVGGLLGKIPGVGKLGGLAAKAGGLVTKIPGVAGIAAKLGGLGSLFGAGSAAAGTTAAAGTAAAGTAATGAAAAGGTAALGSLGAVLGPAALAALAGYGIYRGVKGFSKKNTLENLGASNGISKENQLTGEDRMYSALGLNSKIGAKAMKFTSKVLGIHGLIKGIRGNDNPLTDKEIETGRNKLQRKIDKGMPGYDRILQEYEKAVEAGNWRRARELSGQEADGLIKSLWKNSPIGMVTKGLGNLLFGKKDEEMKKEEIEKTRAKFNSLIEKGGAQGKNAEKLLSKFEDYVSEGDWKNARKIAGLEKRGLFGKLFQDSKGNVKWGKLAMTAIGGIPGFLLGTLFEKKDENKPMSDKEVETERARLQKMADGGNKAAEKILEKFDEAVTEQNWKKARKLCGKEVQSNLAKFGGAVKSTLKWTRRIGTLGLSMLFESDQDKPLTDAEIEKYQKKMQARADHGDKMAERKLDKFNEAIAQQKWEKARQIAKLPDESKVTKAAKATWRFFFGGSGEEPMKEAEITKFRESMQRKINMGSKSAEKKLEAFNNAVEEERWKKARAISKTPDEGILKKGAKALGNAWLNQWRTILGGDGKPMDEAELAKARKQFQIDIAENKKGAQKRSDMFEDYVADEKWEKARKLAKMPYENIAKRALKSVGNFLFGSDDDAMSPEEIDKFQKELEQRVEDGDPKASKLLDAFNQAVENQNWKKAKKLAGIKLGGVVGSVVKGAKSFWNFITGKKDYEDCQKIKEELEEKASEDETGLVDAGITQFDVLVRRQKYNEAMDLAKDILKLKPQELAMKHNLTSDGYEQYKKQAEELDAKISKAIESDNSWFSIKKMRLKSLRSDLKNSGEWSDEYFEELRDRYSSITGEDVFGEEAEGVDDETMEKGKQLLKDVDKTSENFSWIGSPIIKSRLAALRSEIKGDLSMWNDEQFDEWRDKIKEIAGEDAVISAPEWKEEKFGDPEIEKGGRKLLDKIDEYRNKLSWFSSPLLKKQLTGLYDMLSAQRATWSDELFDNVAKQFAELTGQDAEELKASMESDEGWKDAERADKEGKMLLKDIDKTSDKFSWFTSPKIKWNLSRLRSQVEGEEMKWAKDGVLDKFRDRLKEIAGDDAVLTEVPKDDDEWADKERVDRNGKKVLQDIKDTANKFSWIGSPKIKWNLSRLKSRVEGEETEWTDDKLEEYRKRLKDIAGDDAVLSELEQKEKEENGEGTSDSEEIDPAEFGLGNSEEEAAKLGKMTRGEMIEYFDNLKDRIMKSAVGMNVNSPEVAELDDLVAHISKIQNHPSFNTPGIGSISKKALEKLTMGIQDKWRDILKRAKRMKDDTHEVMDEEGEEDQDEIAKRGEALMKDIDDASSKVGFFSGSGGLGQMLVKKGALKALKTRIDWGRGEWSKEKLDEWREKYRKMVKFFGIDDAPDKDNEDLEAGMDENVLAKGKSLVEDIDKTKEEFHWWNSEKSLLESLKQAVEAKKPEWDDENLKQFKEKLKEIAGDKAKSSYNFDAEDQDLERRGRQLIKDIDESTVKADKRWFNGRTVDSLKELRREVDSASAEWSDEKLEGWQKKLKDIAGEDAVVSDLKRKQEEAEEEAEDAEAEELEQKNQELADAAKSVNPVTGNAPVVEEKPPEPGYSNPLAEEHYGKLAIQRKPWLAQVEQPGDPDSEEAAREAWEMETGQDASTYGKSPKKKGKTTSIDDGTYDEVSSTTSEDEDGSVTESTSRTGIRIAGEPVSKDGLTDKQMGIIGMAKAMGQYENYPDYVKEMYEEQLPDYEERRAAKKAKAREEDDEFEERFAKGGFFGKLKRFAKKGLATAVDPFGIQRAMFKKTGAFLNKAKEALVGDGVPVEAGEAGTEAIMPVRNVAGNLLSKVGSKLNSLLHGEDIGPANDVKTADGVVHAEDKASEPTTNLMATELSKNIQPKVIEPETSGGWLDKLKSSVTDFFSPKKEEPKPAPLPKESPNDDKLAQLIEQNQKLIGLLASVIGQNGLKVDGMGDLASAISSMPAGGDTNNVSYNDNNGGPQTGFDLRKKQV